MLSHILFMNFILAGRLAREYILPPAGLPLADASGGSLLYCAGGLRVWEKQAGLLARIGNNYPQEWLQEIEALGFDIRGIKAQPVDVDQRAFIAYSDSMERSQINPVQHFARREMNFPKSLLGYQMEEPVKDFKQIHPLSPAAVDVPKPYRKAKALHICPLDFTTQSQLISVLKSASLSTISLDPAPSYMNSTLWKELRVVLQGVTIFHPSEEELRALFWGETNDLWEMAQTVCNFGCEIVVIKRGGQGQYIYDKASKRKWELPAYPSRVADPTGAGDAFCGGYLAGFLKTNDPLQAAFYGSVSASLKIEGSGPFYSSDVLPGLAQARLYALQGMAREI